MATTIIRILSREQYSVSAMIQIQKIHDDYWRIADQNNSRIAGISKVGSGILLQILPGDMMPDSNLLAMPLIIYYVVMTIKSRSLAAFFYSPKTTISNNS